jgi:hypothetical protein
MTQRPPSAMALSQEQVILADLQASSKRSAWFLDEGALKDRFEIAEIMGGLKKGIGANEGGSVSSGVCASHSANIVSGGVPSVLITRRLSTAICAPRFLGARDHALQPVRLDRVVGIEHGKPAAGGGCDRRVAGGGRSAIAGKRQQATFRSGIALRQSPSSRPSSNHRRRSLPPTRRAGRARCRSPWKGSQPRCRRR